MSDEYDPFDAPPALSVNTGYVVLTAQVLNGGHLSRIITFDVRLDDPERLA